MRRVLLLEARRDLGEPGVARDERRRAGRGGLGGDHPERLRKDRGDDGRVRERQQLDEVAVLERAREERARAAAASSSARKSPKPTIDRPRVEAAQRLEQQVDALVVEKLPEVDDGRARRLRGTRRAARRCPRREAARSRCRDSAGRGEPPRAARRAPRRAAGPELLDVDAGRHLVDAIDVADDLLEHVADVRGADEDGLAPGERLSPPCRELGIAAHRVLELGAVSLDARSAPGRCAHGTAEEHVVREDQVGG